MAESPNTRIRYEIEGGQGKVEIGLDHPLAAPFRKTAQTGGPPGDWNFVLVNAGQRLRIAGTLIHTPSPGNRLLFFPSIQIWPDEELHPSDSGLVEKGVDHFTLDPPKPQKPGVYSSHFTFRDGSKGYGRTIQVPEDHLVPWLAIRLPRPDVLPPAPRNLHVTFSSKRVEADAAVDDYAADILQRGGVTLMGLRPSPYETTFVSLDLWAGWGDDAQNKDAGPMPVDWTASYLSDLPPESQDVPVHAQDAEFPRDARVALLLIHYGGRLAEPRMYQPRAFEGQ